MYGRLLNWKGPEFDSLGVVKSSLGVVRSLLKSLLWVLGVCCKFYYENYKSLTQLQSMRAYNGKKTVSRGLRV